MRRTALGISTGLVLFAAATWPQGPPLEVHVVNASGEPVEHAMVRLRSLSSEVQPLSRPTPRQAGESRPEFWAPTDARGLASFGPLNPVSVEVRVSEDASLWVNGEPEAVNRVDFTGAPGPLVITVNTAEIESVEVTGQVVNSATGQPVSGASVWWGSWAEGGAWATAPRVHADEIGRFHLRVGAYPFEMRIFASAPGFLEAEHRASGNREREEIVALTPAVTLHGFVTRDGDPAPEAELLLLQEMEGAFQIRCVNRGSPLEASGEFLWQPRVWSPAHSLVVALTRSDEVAAARVTIAAPASPGEVIEIGELSLGPGRSMRGRVLDEAGDPIRRATVVWERGRTSEPPAHEHSPWWNQTDANGQFQLTGLPEGTWRFFAGAPGRSEGQFTVEVPAQGSQEFRLRPIQGATARFRLIGEDGSPLPRRRIHVWDARGGSFRNRRQPLWEDGDYTNASGEVVLLEVPVDELTFEVDFDEMPAEGVSFFGGADEPGHVRRRFRRTVPLAEAQDGVTIDMSTWPRVTGRVTRGGTPVPGASVGIYDNPQGDTWASQRTDAEGRYTLSVPPGTYSIGVSVGSQAEWQRESMALSDDQEINIELDH